MADWLRVGVLAAAAWAAVGLGWQFARTRTYGRRRWHAAPAGRPARGIAYAFGPGMSPLAKESAREHLPEYLAGVAYHVGVFCALTLLAVAVAGGAPAGPLARALGLASLAGALAGGSLLARRLASRRLRGLSCPDDYVANALTTGMAALAFAQSVAPGASTAFAAAAGALFLYLPLGKIRHCLFFFATRYHAGADLGRRGVLPPAA